MGGRRDRDAKRKRKVREYDDDDYEEPIRNRCAPARQLLAHKSHMMRELQTGVSRQDICEQLALFWTGKGAAVGGGGKMVVIENIEFLAFDVAQHSPILTGIPRCGDQSGGWQAATTACACAPTSRSTATTPSPAPRRACAFVPL